MLSHMVIEFFKGVKTAVLMVLFVGVAAPILILYMWIDFRRLKRIGMELEPLRPGEKPQGVIGNIIAFFVLPFVVVVGGFQELFLSKDDQEEVY